MAGRQHEELLGTSERVVNCELSGRRRRWVKQCACAMHRLCYMPRCGRGVMPRKRLERGGRRGEEMPDAGPAAVHRQLQAECMIPETGNIEVSTNNPVVPSHCHGTNASAKAEPKKSDPTQKVGVQLQEDADREPDIFYASTMNIKIPALNSVKHVLVDIRGDSRQQTPHPETPGARNSMTASGNGRSQSGWLI
jgi:hypothetical protein